MNRTQKLPIQRMLGLSAVVLVSAVLLFRFGAEKGRDVAEPTDTVDLNSAQ